MATLLDRIDYRIFSSSQKILLASTGLEKDNFRLGIVWRCRVGMEWIDLENVLELTGLLM